MFSAYPPPPPERVFHFLPQTDWIHRHTEGKQCLLREWRHRGQTTQGDTLQGRHPTKIIFCGRI